MKLELLAMAWKSLLANGARTILSMLGIVIGVATVIAVVGIGVGAKQAIEQQFKNLSVNSLIVMGTGGRGASTRVTEDDVPFVLRNSTLIKKGTAMASGSATVTYAKEEVSGSIIGAQSSIFDLQSLEIEFGALFDDAAVSARSNIAVLGQTIAETLFDDISQNAVGKTITVSGRKMEVIGVLKENGSGMGGMSPDDTVYLPYSTAQARVLGNNARIMLMFHATSPAVIPLAQDELTQLLRENHRLRDSVEDDFRVMDAGSMVSSATESTDTMSFLLTSVAIIVLIVSGIGIMNVMFVTVAERTKEIGIMKAVGAQKHDILMQFLMEATVLSMIAGIIGVGLGYGILPFLGDYGAVISPEGGLLGFCFSVVVGIIFGFVPALQASNLDPVDALRSE